MYVAVNVAHVCMYNSIGPPIGGSKGIGGHEGGRCAIIGPVSRSNLSGVSSHYHRLLDISRGQSETQRAGKSMTEER